MSTFSIIQQRLQQTIRLSELSEFEVQQLLQLLQSYRQNPKQHPSWVRDYVSMNLEIHLLQLSKQMQQSIHQLRLTEEDATRIISLLERLRLDPPPTLTQPRVPLRGWKFLCFQFWSCSCRKPVVL